MLTRGFVTSSKVSVIILRCIHKEIKAFPVGVTATSYPCNSPFRKKRDLRYDGSVRRREKLIKGIYLNLDPY